MRRAMGTVALAALMLPVAGSGYTIAPLDAIHERFAWMSESCAAANPVPVDGRIRCAFDDSAIRASANKVPTKPGEQTPIETAVRWGDDPGHATSSLGAGDTAGYLIQFRTCEGQVRDDGKLNTIYRAGVMCSGHYGRLGFFHAMMSVDDAALTDTGQAQKNTRDKILAWASFTYRVAKGEIAPDDKFCSAVSKDKVLAPVFDDGASCRDADAKWTVRRFFTFACANPKLDKSCDMTKDISDAAVRLSALGALLHMIQDSYAQGHVRRLDQPERDSRKNRLLPVVACAAPKQFYYYDKANRDDGHSEADAVPAVELCGPKAEVDDPVSAGATAMWMLRTNKSAGLFMAYLTRRVVPPR